MPRTTAEEKLCARCARPFSNRKRFASRGQWEHVRYCSDACRRNVRRVTP